MNSATPRTFMDPSALNAAVIAAHAPGRFERLLFGFANGYLGLLSRTRLGLRMLRGLQLAHRGRSSVCG